MLFLIKNFNKLFECSLQVRVVVVLPSQSWGGEGCLGAEVVHGYLHTLPDRCRQTTGRSVGGGGIPTNAQTVRYIIISPCATGTTELSMMTCHVVLCSYMTILAML